MPGQPLTEAEIATWRERFPILRRCTYLINNSLGAMPSTVPDALREFSDLWAVKGVEAWASDWLPEVGAVADLIGSLIGAPPGAVVVHQNVATLAGMVASTLEAGGARNRVVLADAEWPGHHYLFGRAAPLDVVPTNGVVIDTERLCAAIDDRTALVVVSHVLFRSAAITDVAAICARAREAGALSLVDGYHATGHMPVDVTAIGADLYVGGSVKWLCGGPGVGYLYVRPDLALARPPWAIGWLGHEQPFAFDLDFHPADGAMSWLGGTPSMPAIYSAREGYRVIAEVGPARIRATSLALTQRLIDGARERGLVVGTPVNPAQRGGAVTIDLGDRAEAVSTRLLADGIVVDYRPRAGIRVGPHFFTTPEECDRLLAALPVGPGRGPGR